MCPDRHMSDATSTYNEAPRMVGMPRSVYPKSVISILSGFLLYIERILVRFLAGIADYVKKKLTKRHR